MIKVLIVTSGNLGKISPFIQDQINALEKDKIEIFKFLIKGNGVFGYLKNYRLLLKAINLYKPDIIHAHYGLSGLLSTLQRKVPVVITFHGCDINVKKNRFLSNIADTLSKGSIYVSKDLAALSNSRKPNVIPCGVDLDIFYPIDKISSRRKMGLAEDKKYILFSSAFNNEVKNYPLAKEAVEILDDKDIELVELKGFTREQVAIMMNAVDLVLLTSLREGSPQFIKEALACNTPIVSVNVGDVKELIDGVEGNFIASNNAVSVAENILRVLEFDHRTKGCKKMIEFDNNEIAKKVINIYKDCLV